MSAAAPGLPDSLLQVGLLTLPMARRHPYRYLVEFSKSHKTYV
jgi:hypothetical protein